MEYLNESHDSGSIWRDDEELALKDLAEDVDLLSDNDIMSG